MSYTISDISFILFNNRSIKGVVKNFLPKDLNVKSIMKIEYQIEFFQKVFIGEKLFEFDKSEFDESSDDIYVTPSDINSLTDKVIKSHEDISAFEVNYLNERGISQDIISKYMLGGLSCIKDYRDLEILNATCHPLLKPLFEDGIDGGGILIPLFKNGILINCAIRKISDVGKLKYSLACPDIDVWGIDDIEGQTVWITEGLFDMMALRSIGLKSASVSSAMWSAIQLQKLLDCKPKKIVIFCDNDSVGLKVGFILNRFFIMANIPSTTVVSNKFKDASSHIFENNLGFEDIKDIDITLDAVDKSSETFNFVSYLKSRNF